MTYEKYPILIEKKSTISTHRLRNSTQSVKFYYLKLITHINYAHINYAQTHIIVF